MTTMEAIAAICADRRAAGRIPVLATDGEVSGITGMSRPETEREMDRLAAAGKVVTGRTVSGRYAFPAETATGMSGCTCSKTTDYTKDQSMSKMFEKAIKAFLDDKAAKDPAFAEKYRSEKKNIADCCKFIIAEVRKSCKGNEAACTDEYVYGLAMHYYDEENVRVPDNVPACSVIVPGNVELSEADRKDAKEEALRRLREQEVQEQLRKERQRQEAAEKKAEAARKRKEDAAERRRKEMEKSGLLFNFDGEDQA